MQALCSRRCLFAEQKAKEAAEKAKDKAQREKLKTRSQWMNEAQVAVNAWIRWRDRALPCICCGKRPQSEALTGGEIDAGHFRSRGAAPELRFDERNIHAQLKRCNRRAFDVAGYRRNLIERIGLEAVEDLEREHPPRKWSISDLRDIRDEYRNRLKLEKKQAE